MFMHLLNLVKQFHNKGIVKKIITCIPHSMEMVREVDSPNDIFETQ